MQDDDDALEAAFWKGYFRAKEDAAQIVERTMSRLVANAHRGRLNQVDQYVHNVLERIAADIRKMCSKP